MSPLDFCITLVLSLLVSCDARSDSMIDEHKLTHLETAGPPATGMPMPWQTGTRARPEGIGRERLLRREKRSHHVHSQKTDWQDYHCFPQGPDDTCVNATEPSFAFARDLCMSMANLAGSFATEDVFGHGPCLQPSYHCKNGGAEKECTSFSYGFRDYALPDVAADSFLNARDWCISWKVNLHAGLANFSTVFGRGECPSPPVYHCFEGRGGTCFPFSYGDRQYTEDSGFSEDTAEGAQDFCLNIDINARATSLNANDVFGNGPCP